MARSCRIVCTFGRLHSSICRRSTAWFADIWWPMSSPSSERLILCSEKSTAKVAGKRLMMNAVMQATIEFLKLYWAPLLCGVAVVAILPLIAGYIVLVERKLMADMQARLGPMRVGPHGLLQPIADAVKLLIKEDIIPENADKMVFWLAPVLSVGAALLSLAGLAIGPAFQIAQDINIGILFVVGISALGIFGIVLGGWASNSHYSLMGALRSSAQLVSYETAAGMALDCAAPPSRNSGYS